LNHHSILLSIDSRQTAYGNNSKGDSLILDVQIMPSFRETSVLFQAKNFHSSLGFLEIQRKL